MYSVLCMSVTHNAGDHLFVSFGKCNTTMYSIETEYGVHNTTPVCMHHKTSWRTLINAPAPPSSLISFISTSVCWYTRSSAADDAFPSDTVTISQSSSSALTHHEDQAKQGRRRKKKKEKKRNLPKMAEFSSSATATLPAGSK